jgi:hypothetical protein
MQSQITDVTTLLRHPPSVIRHPPSDRIHHDRIMRVKTCGKIDESEFWRHQTLDLQSRTADDVSIKKQCRESINEFLKLSSFDFSPAWRITQFSCAPISSG